MSDESRPKGSPQTSALLIVLIVLGVLYLAREVLIPLALAILLAFLLAPLVIRLRRAGLGRTPAALLVVLFAFGVIGSLGTVMVSQSTDLVHQLPQYEQNVHKKLEAIRDSGGWLVQRVTRVAHNFTSELVPPAAQTGTEGKPRPVPVEIQRGPFAPLEIAQKVLGSVMSMAISAVIVIVFVVFILIEREDLRDRVIRLAGAGRVNVTTRVLDDAAHRVSRYLVAQLVINVAFGTLAGIGLYFVGVPNPLLWGMLAALLRYIPYVGIWIAAVLPALLAFAVEPGWVKVPLVVGLYVGIDMLIYNFAEPLLYGSSTGITPLAILVAAVFWTWLWGPVGLLMATPLTVCVVVVGHHVPSLGFLRVLLSDEPVLPAQTRFYQRMLATDLEEAGEVAAEFLKGRTLEELYDQVIIPALSLAEEDRHVGKLAEKQYRFIFQNTRILLDHLAASAEEIQLEGPDKLVSGLNAGSVPSESASAELQRRQPAATVLCIPARDEADELGALMLGQLLNKRGILTNVARSGGLAGESLQQVRELRPKVACICAVPPFGYMHARYLCRRIRDEFQEVKIVADILTEQDVEEVRQRKPPLVTDEVASSLRQALGQITSLLPVITAQKPTTVLERT